MKHLRIGNRASHLHLPQIITTETTKLNNHENNVGIDGEMSLLKRNQSR